MKMRKRLVVAGVVFAVVATTLMGCGKQTTATGDEGATKETTASETETKATDQDEPSSKMEDITIGVSFQGLSDEYIVRLSDAFKEQADKEGVSVQIADGQMDAETQVGQVENFISQGVDVIVLNPISAGGCAPAVTAAREAGIPIITLISTTSNQDEASTYVGSNAIESGEIQAEMVVADLEGQGNIVVMFGQMGHDAQIGRYQGLKNKLEGTDIQIIAEQTGDWSREEGMKVMENWIASGKEIDAVVAQNDAMALGAIMAIEAAGKSGEIKVYGIDAQAEALAAVENGSMEGTVFQNAARQGSECVGVAIKAAMGESLEGNYYIPYEGVRVDNAKDYK